MPRVFVYDGREFDDPDDSKSVQEVQDYLSHFYPELNTATVSQREDNGRTLYEFRKRVGTKGLHPSRHD